MADYKYYFKKWEKLLKDGNILSILLTGVGGQGILLTSRVLSEAALLSGLDVKVSEVHGMSQRGGSVIGSVRMGNKVYSPTVGKADFIISLEKLEALRYINKLDSDGFIISNDAEIYPISVFYGDIAYPKDIISRIGSITSNYMIVEALKIAKKLNEIRATNIVLLGCLSNFIPLDYECWIAAIKKNVPRKAVDINLEAFREGRKIIN